MTRPMHSLLPAGLVVVATLLAGCDRIGNPLEALGRRAPPPDEFAVIKRKPLIVPPSAALPVPQPGAPSPLDPTPERDAQIVLLGRPAGPAAGPATAGETALLRGADAAAASGDVRVQLSLDATQQSGEYRPPTVLELLGFEEDGLDAAERLDPVAESQRLQRQGVYAPTDPRALPPEPQ